MNDILTVGAYDRDNFGDILFYILISKILPEIRFIPGGFSTTSKNAVFNENVLPYPALMNVNKWRKVLVVGGEVGGVTIRDANRMLMDEAFERTYMSVSKEIENLYNKSMCFEPSYVTAAYIPNSISANSEFILLSSGLSSLENLPLKVMTDAIESLKRYKRIWVRDKSSHIFCNNHKIISVLQPDLVHSISKIYKKKSKQKIEKSYIAFQMSKEYIEKNSVGEIIDSISKIIKLTNKKIILFAAGTAPYHDSIALYEEIKKGVDDKRLTLNKERDPLSIVRLIANSDAVVGTSLHVRIVAISYNIPRISLDIKKVSQYCGYWDENFPFNINIKDVSDYLGAIKITKESREKSRQLTEKAYSTVKEFVTGVS